MSFSQWCLVLGALALVSAVGSARLRRLPLSEPLIFLVAGLALGNVGGVSLSLVDSAHWLERVAEVVVIVSLFVGGLKLRLPLGHRAWLAAYRLAGPAMLLCIAGIALVGTWLFGLTPATALLLGAILAPTDPVLADEFAVSSAKDQDRLRYGLSGEAGLNDGTAFPFVALGLLLIENGGHWGVWVGGWALERLLWAVPAGLLLGYALGYGGGRLVVAVRRRTADRTATSDLLLLALVGLSYGLAEMIHAWGFLSVFAAGVGLRRAEVWLGRPQPGLLRAVAGLDSARWARHRPGRPQPEVPDSDPAEALVEPWLHPEALRDSRVASGLVVREVLALGEALERLFVLAAVLLVGVLLAENWDWRGVGLGLALFLVIRPLAVGMALLGTPTTRYQRLLMGWFGIRGLGSLYYLFYSVGEGVGAERSAELGALTLSVVALSVALHGVSATPLLRLYERRLGGHSSAEPQVGLSAENKD
ncbi:MAG: cation:proton antiporter [Meiothermus sp.]|nr:cation:proton antiporter [Meiothermus sp.]